MEVKINSLDPDNFSTNCIAKLLVHLASRKELSAADIIDVHVT